ncbi:serum response factor-like isoform X2 [Hemiscyllium ocellatum]|uniref:serum response factor-like isoform X2 n=1 Tax=Hemiscyllium ocellatum TaxID=170820 RepID=UPI0029674C9A|nr:serum response factor-like isoform X2 [Hemiscyllium ocellatum]
MLQNPAAAAPPEPNSSSSSPAGSLQPAAPGTGPGPGPQAAAAAVLVSRDREAPLPGPPYSCSEPSSDEDEELVVAPAPAPVPLDRRGVKRRLSDLEAAAAAGLAGVSGHGPGLEPGPGGLAATGGYGATSAPGGTAPGAGLKPGKKTRGRVKIKMEFIDNKLRRYTTFSKRKTGIMKKAYELSTLTGTQVLLLVASETGHVYTFATRKLQPMITSETGKALIQTCLNSPDSPPRSDPTTDQRMSATGFEETDLTYQVSETDSSGENKDNLKPTTFTVANVPGSTGVNQSASNTSTNLQVSTGHNFPITNYLAPVTAISNSNGAVFKSTGTGTSGSMVQLPSGFTIMSGGAMAQQVPVQTIQLHQASGQVSVHQSTQHTPSTSDSNSEISQASTSGAMTLPATIVTSSVPTSMASHVMYPSPHGTVMYTTSSPGLSDGGLTVLNAFSQPSSGMQVSHGQMQEQGGVPQVVLTAPTGTVQIPLSAVQLHQMAVIGQQSCTGSLTELQVSSLETTHSNKLAQND